MAEPSQEAKLDKSGTEPRIDKQLDGGSYEEHREQTDWEERELHDKETEPTCECTDYMESLAALQGETEKLQQKLQECKAADSNPPPEQPYFKQYINVLLKNFREQGVSSKDNKSDLSLRDHIRVTRLLGENFVIPIFGYFVQQGIYNIHINTRLVYISLRFILLTYLICLQRYVNMHSGKAF